MADKQTPSVCQIAHDLTNTDRIASYGHPKINFDDIARMWSVILRPILKPGEQVTATQVGLCNVATKICRHVSRPKRDNLIDMAGYANTIDKLDDILDEECLPSVYIPSECSDIRPAFPIPDRATQLVNKWADIMEPVPELSSDIDPSPGAHERAVEAFYKCHGIEPPKIKTVDVSHKATPSEKVKINRIFEGLVDYQDEQCCGMWTGEGKP